MPQFDRRITVRVGPSGGQGLAWSDLDVAFQVIKTDTPEPNTARVTIWNLSEASRSYLLQPGLDLIVEAGYADAGPRVIFRGDVDSVAHYTATEDKTTVIQGLDGKRARGRRLSRSYNPGTSLRTVVDDLVSALGIPTGDVAALTTLAGQRTQGLVVAGPAGRYLDTLLASAGLTWTVQDGSVQIYPEGSNLGASAVLISPQTGMVGQPERTVEETKAGGKIPGLQVTTLLDPLAAPGLRVQVDSAAFKGVYRTRRVEHRGVTDGQEWYTIRDLQE